MQTPCRVLRDPPPQGFQGHTLRTTGVDYNLHKILSYLNLCSLEIMALQFYSMWLLSMWPTRRKTLDKYFVLQCHFHLKNCLSPYMSLYNRQMIVTMRVRERGITAGGQGDEIGRTQESQRQTWPSWFRASAQSPHPAGSGNARSHWEGREAWHLAFQRASGKRELAQRWLDLWLGHFQRGHCYARGPWGPLPCPCGLVGRTSLLSILLDPFQHTPPCPSLIFTNNFRERN